MTMIVGEWAGGIYVQDHIDCVGSLINIPSTRVNYNKIIVKTFLKKMEGSSPEQP